MSIEPQPQKNSFFRRHRAWRAYLFEFVLLFLAVFLGFVAENYRESISERELTKEMAQNFYDELRTDSIAFQSERAFRYAKCNALLELKAYIRDSTLDHVSKGYVRNFYLGTISIARFEPTKVILEQLQNSGTLRNFRNKDIQILIGRLSATITTMNNVHEYETQFEQMHLTPYVMRHNDDSFYSRITGNGKVTLGGFIHALNTDTVKLDYKVHNLNNYDRLATVNMLGIYHLQLKGATDVVYSQYNDVNHRLLNMLRTEYHLR